MDYFNRYAYTVNNPVNFIDPDGMQCGTRLEGRDAIGCETFGPPPDAPSSSEEPANGSTESFIPLPDGGALQLPDFVPYCAGTTSDICFSDSGWLTVNHPSLDTPFLDPRTMVQITREQLSSNFESARSAAVGDLGAIASTSGAIMLTGGGHLFAQGTKVAADIQKFRSVGAGATAGGTLASRFSTLFKPNVGPGKPDHYPNDPNR